MPPIPLFACGFVAGLWFDTFYRWPFQTTGVIAFGSLVGITLAIAGLALFAAGLLLALGLARSPIGRVLVAIRENEERTRLLGYNTFAYKLLALVVSGVISGTAGSLYTLLFSYVGSSFASILYSIYPLLWTLLGGAGTALGTYISIVKANLFDPDDFLGQASWRANVSDIAERGALLR